MQNSSTSDEQACTQRHSAITYADLPLSCPPRDERVWDAHPRVYLPIEDVGKLLCPYCGTEYVLTDFKPKEIE
jgi:uncharacterized Zn-finger protein